MLILEEDFPLSLSQEGQSPGFVSCSTVVATAAILKFLYYIIYLNSVIEKRTNYIICIKY